MSARVVALLPRIRYSFAFLVVLLIAVSGCLQDENPNLLNPPVVEGSIKVRLLNLAADRQARSLSLENQADLAPTPFASLSPFLEVAQDSAFATILRGSDISFRSDDRLRLFRNTFQTLVALPADPLGSLAYIDTLLIFNVLNDTTSRPANVAFLRFLNAVPDRNRRYSLRLGCPNGRIVASSLAQKTLSAPFELPAGDYVVSMTGQDIDSGESDFQQSFSITVAVDQDYMIVLYEQAADEAEVLFIDERAESLLPIVQTTATESRMRAVNLGTRTVDVLNVSGESAEEIAIGLGPQNISPFRAITACLRETADTISILGGAGDTLSNRSIALDVQQEYTVLVSDSVDKPGAHSSIALPYSMLTDGAPANEANVRAVHLASGLEALQVDMGARTRKDGQYEPGQTISRKLAFGDVSAPVVVAAGAMPLMIFTEREPRRLAALGYGEIEAGKRYLIIVANDAEGNPLAYLLDEEEDFVGDPMLTPMPSGVFTQFFNVVADAESITVSYGDLISEATRFHDEVGATVLRPGSHRFQAGTNEANVELVEGQRTLIIVSGLEADPDITVLSSDPLGAERNQIRRRFINGSNVVPFVNTSIDSVQGEPIASDLAYLTASEVQTLSIERRLSFFYWEPTETPTDDDILIMADNISLNFGKNYSVVFYHRVRDGQANTKNDAIFRVRALQEF